MVFLPHIPPFKRVLNFDNNLEGVVDMSYRSGKGGDQTIVIKWA